MNNKYTDEKELLIGLKSSDEHSFDMLYKMYSKRLFHSILLLVKSEELTLDIIQDVFMKVWQRRHYIDTEKSFKSYLYVISNNFVKDYFRKVSKDQKMKDYYLNQGIDSFEGIEPSLAFKETNQLLEKALDTLSENERAVFVLCRLEGKSYSEAAEVLGLSSSTVGNNLVRATSKVKVYLSGSVMFWALIISSL